MAKPEKISKYEAETRKKEINCKKNKGRDYRRWANKHLAPGELPSKMSGFGEGKITYCPTCDLKCHKSTYKDKWYCGECGGEAYTMTKTEFEKMRKAQENDNDTDKHVGN